MKSKNFIHQKVIIKKILFFLSIFVSIFFVLSGKNNFYQQAYAGYIGEQCGGAGSPTNCNTCGPADSGGVCAPNLHCCPNTAIINNSGGSGGQGGYEGKKCGPGGSATCVRGTFTSSYSNCSGPNSGVCDNGDTGNPLFCCANPITLGGNGNNNSSGGQAQIGRASCRER